MIFSGAISYLATGIKLTHTPETPRTFSRHFTGTNLSLYTLLDINKLATNLESLVLSSCRIKSLPGDFFNNLPRIKWVDLRWNLMISLPVSLSHHPMLEVMLLDENLFTSLPTLVATLPRLHTLGLRGNIISSPPAFVVSQGVRAIQAWIVQVSTSYSLIGLICIESSTHDQAKPK